MILSRSREAYSLLKFSKCHSKKTAFKISTTVTHIYNYFSHPLSPSLSLFFMPLSAFKQANDLDQATVSVD
jgi:hypothetical protein